MAIKAELTKRLTELADKAAAANAANNMTPAEHRHLLRTSKTARDEWLRLRAIISKRAEQIHDAAHPDWFENAPTVADLPSFLKTEEPKPWPTAPLPEMEQKRIDINMGRNTDNDSNLKWMDF
jgi:hypothetical protein